MNWYALQVAGGMTVAKQTVAVIAQVAEDMHARRGGKMITIAGLDAFARIPVLRDQTPILPGYVLLQTPQIAAVMRRVQAAVPRICQPRLAGMITPAEMLVIERIEAIGTGAVELIEPGTIEMGDLIEITEGPLAGQTFAFSRWSRQRGTWRMVVHLEALGRHLSVTIDRDAAQRVRKAAADRRAKG